MSIYIDTCILVSLYVPEVGSEKAKAFLKKNDTELLISQLAEVEFYSALSLKSRTKTLPEEQRSQAITLFEKHLHQGPYVRIHITESIYQLAKTFLASAKVPLRALDALHLACTKQAKATLLTADKELHHAAKAFKITAVCP